MTLLLALSSLCLAAGKPPHVLLIVADDYGWGNLGVHRQNAGDSLGELQGKLEVHTPTLDRLIDEGILLDRHYAFHVCSPSRSSLQSGRLPVHVNKEMKDLDLQLVNPKDPVSGFAGIPRNMTCIAEKLLEAGYRTHLVGKWDVGIATPQHSPKGRGYETWYGFYGHANDYWHATIGLTSAEGSVDVCLNQMRDLSMHNSSYCGPALDDTSLSALCESDDDKESEPSCYEEHRFKERVLEIIRFHDTEKPLFLLYAFHLLHTPLQVPQMWLRRIDDLVKVAGGHPIDSKNRRQYAAMTLYMDAAIGEAVEALKEKKMYENTLIIFVSDNGGPIYEPGGASNHPLRGGKRSVFEGGLRTNAFVSGGFVPESRRGTKFEGVISIADWYGTLAELAGVDIKDKKAEAANWWLRDKGLPLLFPVDSVPQWQHILQNRNGRADPLQLAHGALLMWPYKLITGKIYYGGWTGPVYPNCSTLQSVRGQRGPLPVSFKSDAPTFLPELSDDELDVQLWAVDCGEGCLFNVRDDPTEHVDLARDPDYASLFWNMHETLELMNKDIFEPDRGAATVEACMVAIEHGRTLGPFVDIGEFYSSTPARSPDQQAEDAVLSSTLRIMNLDENKLQFLNELMEEAKHAPHEYDKCLVPMFRDVEQ
ncbi:ARSB [Symbiodinium necroappetens]|uniref:ARSB protein n=1 Tax=Symbiodinium necroappetens TaxID=1628268 RepID=A0A812Z3J5_9DINO|nr:ARSB [Symbiodinium necroappetens]